MFEIAKQQWEDKLQIMLTRKRFPANNSHKPSSCQWDPFTFTLSQVFLAKQSISDKEKYLPLSQVFLKKKKILLFPKVFLTKQNLFLFSKYFWQRKTFYTIPNISSETKYISVPKYFWQSKVSFQPEQFLPSKVLSQDMIVLTRNQI